MVKHVIWGAILALGLAGCGGGPHAAGPANATGAAGASGSKTGAVVSSQGTSAAAASIVIPAHTHLPPTVQKNVTAVIQQLNQELQQLKQEMGG